MPAFIDLTGQRFGRLVVLHRDGTVTGNRVYWICRCDCGEKKSISRSSLRTGGTASCGCWKSERDKLPRGPKSIVYITHGMKTRANPHPVYTVWSAMKRRCNDPNDQSWKNYGGRGIRACDEWIESFETFFADMGDRPSPKHSIDRIDNDGNYEPSNCRWATRHEQMMNRRKKTHCKYDHPFDDENTYVYPDGSRGCRKCNNDSHQKRREDKRNAD